MSLRRAWNELGRRWFASPPRLELSQVIQPVVVIDDASGLSVPPLHPMYTRFHGVGAVVGEFGIVELRATTKVVEVVAFWAVVAGHQFHAAVSKNTGAATLTAIPAAEIPHYQIAGPWDAFNDTGHPTAILYEGADASPDTVYDPGGAFEFVSSAARYAQVGMPQAWVPTILLPGHSLVVTTSAANTSLTYSLIWREMSIAQGDQLDTSDEVTR